MAFQLIPFIFDLLVATSISVGASYLAAAFIKKPSQKMPQRSNFPTQSSMKGAAIPKVYGTRRVAGNVLWVKDVGTWEIAVNYEVPTRSFLLGICEGPAKVKKIWLGKRLLWDSAGTRKAHGVFISDGDGTKAYHLGDATSLYPDQYYWLSELTEEEFGDYPNLCCAWFYRRVCTIDGAIPEFTFEVTTYPSSLPYFVGIDSNVSWYEQVTKVSSESAIDTSWGDSGYWDGPEAGGISYTAHRLADGRILVSHTYYTVTMIDTDGTTDTSWGTNGSYTMPSNVEIRAILEDSDGNIHLFGGVHDSGYTYVKIDSNGNYVTGLDTNRLRSFSDAIWANSAKTRIITVGAVTVISGKQPNMMAIEPSTGTVDTSWQGNLSLAGYANWGGAGNTIYHCKLLSGGDFVIMNNDATNTLVKILSDGSGVDTSWGTNGIVALGAISVNPSIPKIAEHFGNLYVLTYDTIGGTDYNIISHVGPDGTVVNSHNIETGYGQYHCLSMINGRLHLGTKAQSPAQHNVEVWSNDLTYVEGFDIPNIALVYFIIGDNFVTTTGDMNPAVIIRDLVVSKRYGARFDSSKIDIADLETFCNENDLLISLALKERKPLEHWIDHILAHCNGYRLWSGDTLKLGAFRDQDPVDPPIVQADLYPKGPGPKVGVIVRDRSETFNRVEIGWSNRQNLYDYSSEPAQDQVDQRVSEAQGLPAVRISTNDLDGICRIELARQIAWQKLYEGMYRFKMFKFKVGYKHMLMEVGDVKLLSDGHKIVNQKIRILSIKEEQFGRVLSVEAIEDTSAMYPAIDYSSQEAWTPWVLFAGDSLGVTDAGSISVTPIKINENDGVGVTDSATVSVI